MLRSDLGYYSDAYIVLKGKIYLGVAGNDNMTQKGVVFKNNVPFRSCISKINNTGIANGEDLHIVNL